MASAAAAGDGPAAAAAPSLPATAASAAAAQRASTPPQSSQPPAAAASGGSAGSSRKGSRSGGVSFSAAQDACQSLMQRLHSATPKADPAFSGDAFSFGSVDVHAGGLKKHIRLRQSHALNDRLSAATGLWFDLASHKVGPFGSLTYSLDADNPGSKSRIELSTLNRRLLVRKGWDVTLASATIGVSAEAGLTLRDRDGDAAAGGAADATAAGAAAAGGGTAAGRYVLRPDIHFSLDHIKPLKYELLGVGAVLLLGLPLALSGKEAEGRLLPFLPDTSRGLRWLRGAGRVSLKRVGYARGKVGLGEASAVLEL